MRLLNVGCGATRLPLLMWTNLDNLHDQLAPGTPERRNLDMEANYVNHNIADGRLPFPDSTFNGCLLSHVIEHFNCHDSVALLREVLRVLVPHGMVLVSVPDASYFREIRHEDAPENAKRLFGEEIYAPDGEPTFLDYALFYWQHKQVLTEDALWCLLERAGFTNQARVPYELLNCPVILAGQEFELMFNLLNRRKFSLVMTATKQE